MFTNELNISLPQWARVGKIIHEVETYWPFGRENIPSAASQ